MTCTSLNRACTGSLPVNSAVTNLQDVVFTEDATNLYLGFSWPYSDGEIGIAVVFGTGVLDHYVVESPYVSITIPLASAGNYTIAYRTEYEGEASEWTIAKVVYNQGVYNTDKLLLETGDVMLLESGDKILLEEV